MRVKRWSCGIEFILFYLFRRGSRGGEMGEFSHPPPPSFSEPPSSFFFFLSLKYWNNIWFLWFLWLRWRMCISDDWITGSTNQFIHFEPTNTLSSVCTRRFCVFQSWLDRLKSDHVLIVGVPLQQKRLRSIGSALSQYRF